MGVIQTAMIRISFPGRLLLFLFLVPLSLVLSCTARAAESANLTEISSGWRLTSADHVPDDSAVTRADFDDARWYPVKHMPATVLQVLKDNTVYPDLYYGMNLT